MSASPKFRITVIGVASGFRGERVRAALGKQFSLSHQQVELMLANQGGPLSGLMDHGVAWELKSQLQDLGLDCRLAPVPRSHLAGNVKPISLQAVDSDRHIGHAPRVKRASHHALQMRSGKVNMQAKPVTSKAFTTVPPYWRVAVVVAIAFAMGWYFQPNHGAGTDSAVVADAVR